MLCDGRVRQTNAAVFAMHQMVLQFDDLWRRETSAAGEESQRVVMNMLFLFFRRINNFSRRDAHLESGVYTPAIPDLPHDNDAKRHRHFDFHTLFQRHWQLDAKSET